MRTSYLIAGYAAALGLFVGYVGGSISEGQGTDGLPWISALSGWAAAFVALPTIFVLLKQLNELKTQTAYLIGDLEPEFYCKGGGYFIGSEGDTGFAMPERYFVIVNNNRHRMLIRRFTFEADAPFDIRLNERIPFDHEAGSPDRNWPAIRSKRTHISARKCIIRVNPFDFSIVGYRQAGDENALNFMATVKWPDELANPVINATIEFHYANAPDVVLERRFPLYLDYSGAAPFESTDAPDY